MENHNDDGGADSSLERRKKNLTCTKCEGNIIPRSLSHVLNRTCAICFINVGCDLIDPCGHGLLCSECMRQIRNNGNQCPFCRVKIENDFALRIGCLPRTSKKK